MASNSVAATTLGSTDPVVRIRPVRRPWALPSQFGTTVLHELPARHSTSRSTATAIATAAASTACSDRHCRGHSLIRRSRRRTTAADTTAVSSSAQPAAARPVPGRTRSTQEAAAKAMPKETTGETAQCSSTDLLGASAAAARKPGSIPMTTHSRAAAPHKAGPVVMRAMIRALPWPPAQPSGRGPPGLLGTPAVELTPSASAGPAGRCCRTGRGSRRRCRRAAGSASR